MGQTAAEELKILIYEQSVKFDESYKKTIKIQCLNKRIIDQLIPEAHSSGSVELLAALTWCEGGLTPAWFWSTGGKSICAERHQGPVGPRASSTHCRRKRF